MSFYVLDIDNRNQHDFGVRGCQGQGVVRGKGLSGQDGVHSNCYIEISNDKWVVGDVLVTSIWKHIKLLKLLVDLCEHIQQSCCSEIGHVVRGVIDWCKM